jgi:hypothetical protein
VIIVDLDLGTSKPPFRIGLGGKGALRRAVHTVRPSIARLIAAGRQPPNPAEAAP